MNTPKYLSAIILSIAFALFLFAMGQTDSPKPIIDKEKLALIDSIGKLNARIDTLTDDLFIEKVTNGRYELSILHLMEVNPKAAKEFNNFMEHETE
jgi:hypothetical protein